MASIFDLTSNQQGVDNLLKELEDLRIKEIQERKEAHRRTHFFKSYEEALNWCETTGNGIEWHCKTLFYEADKNKFKSYEHEFDADGIIPYDVVRYYTKEELMKSINEHIKYINKKYPDQAYLEWWLDEDGYLDYVYALI